MGLPESVGVFLFIGASFFLILGIGIIIYARREKEKIIYLTATSCFLVSLTTVLMFLEQFLLAILLFISSILLAAVVGPKTTRISDRVYAKILHEIDFSVPLRMRDFLTLKGWAVMVSRGDHRKAILLIWLPSVIIGGGGLGLILCLVGIMNMTRAVTYTIFNSIFFTIFFYRQIRRSLSLLEET